MRSEEFFSDPEALPTHNSHAIESQLHHIQGLSEHFLYSNDDMFFGRPVQPSMFFSPGGVTKFIEAQTRIGLGENDPARSGFENAARVNRRLLWERFGRVITRHLEHAAAPLRTSVLLRAGAGVPRGLRPHAAQPVPREHRHLGHQLALPLLRADDRPGRAAGQRRVLYVDTTARAGLGSLPGMLKKRDVDLFCLNDGSFPEVSAEERATLVLDFLEKYFPIVAPWERTAAEDAQTPA